MLYHKINSLFKRDPETHKLIQGAFCSPETEYLAENQWEWTEKVDGTNVRLWFDVAGRISAGGRTERANLRQDLVDELTLMFWDSKIKEVFDEPDKVMLFGEGYGGKIQNGSSYREGPSFILFDVNVGGWWLKRDDVEDIADKLGIDAVPVVGRGTIWEAIRFVKTKPASLIGLRPTAEGVVVRPTVEVKRRNGGRIIEKIKVCDFCEGEK